MTGITLSAAVITGVKAGIVDSTDMLSDTINNQYLTELAVMFIGFAVIVGVIMYFLKGHRKI